MGGKQLTRLETKRPGDPWISGPWLLVEAGD